MCSMDGLLRVGGLKDSCAGVSIGRDVSVRQHSELGRFDLSERPLHATCMTARVSLVARRTPFEHLINLCIERLDGGGIRLGDRQSLLRNVGSRRRRRSSLAGRGSSARGFRHGGLQFIDLFLEIRDSRFHGLQISATSSHHQEGKDESLCLESCRNLRVKRPMSHTQMSRTPPSPNSGPSAYCSSNLVLCNRAGDRSQSARQMAMY
jgi:hypothetical protein